MRRVRATGFAAMGLIALAGCTAGPGAEVAVSAQEDLVGMHRATLERCLAEVDSVRSLSVAEDGDPARTVYRADNEIGGGRDDAEGYPVLAVNTRFADDFDAPSALDTNTVRPRLRRGTWCEAHFTLEDDRVTEVDYITATGIDFLDRRLEPCGAIVALCVADRAQPAAVPTRIPTRGPALPEVDEAVAAVDAPPSDVTLDSRARALLDAEHGVSSIDGR